MNITVCVKLIPNAEAQTRIDLQSMTLDRSEGLVLDDSDTYSVEMALQIVEAQGSGEVTVVSMAPRDGADGLRTALATGASNAVLVSDSALSGSDALSTAKVLAAVVRRVGADLVLCATESTDGYTGTVPSQLAELLGYPSVTFARRVEASADSVVVERQTEEGFDRVRCPIPVVISVTAGIVEPRYPTFRGIMRARSLPIDIVSLADLEIPEVGAGALGARQTVLAAVANEGRGAGVVEVDEGNAEERIVELLSEWKVI